MDWGDDVRLRHTALGERGQGAKKKLANPGMQVWQEGIAYVVMVGRVVCIFSTILGGRFWGSG